MDTCSGDAFLTGNAGYAFLVEYAATCCRCLLLVLRCLSITKRFQPYALRVATENDYHGGMGDPMLRYGAVNAR